jgi:hypothetical protein
MLKFNELFYFFVDHFLLKLTEIKVVTMGKISCVFLLQAWLLFLYFKAIGRLSELFQQF